MRRPIVLLIIMAIAYSQSEITSPSILNGTLFPLLFAAALVILIVWLITRPDNNPRDAREPSESSNLIDPSDSSDVAYSCDSSTDGDSGGDCDGGD